MKKDTVFELKNKERFLHTGCPNLDVFLKGGLSRNGITQIYGESGTGKTQLALQLCLSAQLPGNLNDIGGIAYICTEAVFPSSRLQELIKKSPISNSHVISNEIIFIEHASTTEDLENCIFNPQRLPQLLSKNKIKLLVIDSIAATYRVEYDLSKVKNRAKSLRMVGFELQKLARMYNMAVICINQVTAIVGKSCVENVSIKEQPSLGITWASMITTSLYMYKKNNQRFLYISGSNYLPCKVIEYEIHDFGVLAKNI